MREKLKAIYEPVKDAAILGNLGSRDREFRDALTKAEGSVHGIRTNALQWMGSSGSK